jgi:hypothetical protein
MKMKTNLLILVLAISFFYSTGQVKNTEQKVETAGLFEPYQSLSVDTEEWNTEFIGLFNENGKFHLKPTSIYFEKGFNDCLSDSVIYLVPNDENCIFLFSFFTGYNTSPIETVNEGKAIEMMPDTYFNFIYNNIEYTFQANGEMDDGNIKNYTLSFCKTDCQTKQNLVTRNLIESTIVSILFIGDLDGDGKPDIILDASHHYEYKKILLFLSSTKENNELLHSEAEMGKWLDC